MAATIRLQRKGQTKQPYYRVIVTDSSAGTQAGYIANLGTYNPEAEREEDELDVDEEAALEWMQKGAMPSDTVRDLFNRLGLMQSLRDPEAAVDG